MALRLIFQNNVLTHNSYVEFSKEVKHHAFYNIPKAIYINVPIGHLKLLHGSYTTKVCYTCLHIPI